MTSLKKRLDTVLELALTRGAKDGTYSANVNSELAIIRESLNRQGRFPSCCFTINADGEFYCDTVGPLAKEQFLDECESCQAWIKDTVARFKMDKVEIKANSQI